MNELLKNASSENTGPNPKTQLSQSRNADILSSLFSSESNQSAFLCRSFIYERARAEFHSRDVRYWHGPPKDEHQKSAHLHCLYGVPRLFAYPSARRQTRHNLMHPFACSKVYDLRQYTDKNHWGPFMDDGTMRVDWEKVEAVMIVLGANMDDLGLSRIPMCEAFFSIPFAGTWQNSWKPPISTAPFPPSPPRELNTLEQQDPYGVTGAWLRVVCFLDYSDFFTYNFGSQQLPPHVPSPSINLGQATRLILMRIFVTAIEKPGPEDGQDLPVVHFKGVSRSLEQSFDENANSGLRGTVFPIRGVKKMSRLRRFSRNYQKNYDAHLHQCPMLTKDALFVIGTVRLTPHGDVHWTTFSIYDGVERWRSESVQVGGVKSAKGVLGHWFDK